MDNSLKTAAHISLILTLTACGGGSDDGGVTGSDSSPVNAAPVISMIKNKATYQNTGIGIGLTASDSNGDTLTYSTSLSNNANFEVVISDGILHITPINKYFGDEVITVKVSDGELEDSTNFTLQVLQISIPPVAQIASDEISTPPAMPTF